MDDFKISIHCPDCASDAFYKYGKTPGGKQKFICLVCERQFVASSFQQKFGKRPACPKCGSRMHLYRREKKYVRFRCADYPKCRTYIKVIREE